MTTEWHPILTSYEWWRDIGTGSLGVIAAILTAAATLIVAIRSHQLATKVATAAEKRANRDRDEAEKRADRDRDDRYRDGFGRVIDSAMAAIVAYGNEVQEGSGKTVEEQQLHAAAQARLLLVHATANDADAPATQAVLEEFLRVRQQVRWDVRRGSAGLLAGALANVLARQDSPEDVALAVRKYIDQETAEAIERTRTAREQASAE